MGMLTVCMMGGTLFVLVSAWVLRNFMESFSNLARLVGDHVQTLVWADGSVPHYWI
jgi:flagellar biogenesis protein FliO